MTQLFAPPLSGEELMDAGTFSELHAQLARRDAPARVAAPARPAPFRAPAAPAASSAPAAPVATAALEAEIDRASRREAVTRLAVQLARRYASATALLLVHRDIIQGLCADGLPGRPDAVLFPAGSASVFGAVAASGRPFRGAPPAAGLDARILGALGRSRVREIAVLPVSLSGRVVNLLYADNGPEAIGDAPAAALTAVCARLAAAYERLIREHKRNA